MAHHLPMSNRQPSEWIAWYEGKHISVTEFFADIERTAQALPSASYAVNTCADRYAFMVLFFAICRAGQTNLLPANRASHTIDKLLAEYPNAYTVTDQALLRTQDTHSTTNTSQAVPLTIAADHLCAIAFTSGSTGAPQPNPKTWDALQSAAQMHVRYLDQEISLTQHHSLVATPPPWHMYGLEWTMMIALWAPISVYCGTTHFPNDITHGFARMNREPTDNSLLFVTTPTHLEALLKTQRQVPNISRVISATAPLAADLVEQTERQLNTKIYEIYGCSEAGTLACRRPAQDDGWLLMDAFHQEVGDGQIMIDAAYLPQPIVLPDAVEFLADGRFRLLGRASDLVKVAGKRASLAELTAQLQNITGVIDAVVFQPEQAGLAPSVRLAAFVVAERSSEEIRSALKEFIDPAFMPRPLLRVPDLKRNATGKITTEALRSLADACQLP